MKEMERIQKPYMYHSTFIQNKKVAAKMQTTSKLCI